MTKLKDIDLDEAIKRIEEELEKTEDPGRRLTLELNLSYLLKKRLEQVLKPPKK